MLIIPAIDLQSGSVVRLVQGLSGKKIYSTDPAKTARHWTNQGARLIHVVDLDGATKGSPQNLAAVRKIIGAVDVPVEFGGGLRRLSDIEELISGIGVRRVVLGTKAAEDEEFLKKALKKFKDRIIVSIDALSGKVRTKGWRASSGNKDAVSFAKSLKKLGLKEIIYTDISRDGMLKGPDIRGIKKLLAETGLSVIASGGVSSLSDIRKLKGLVKSGLSGAIIGKALYEGKFTLAQAIKTGN